MPDWFVFWILGPVFFFGFWGVILFFSEALLDMAIALIEPRYNVVDSSELDSNDAQTMGGDI